MSTTRSSQPSGYSPRQLESDLGTTTAWATWTVSIYLLSASVATPLLGRLGDQFGKDRLLRVTLIVFVIGSFRAIQGVGGAVYPLGFSILRDELPPERAPWGWAWSRPCSAWAAASAW